MKEFLGVLLFVVAIIAFSFVLVTGITMYGCYGYEKQTGRETKYHNLTCYVKQDGVWYTEGEFKFKLAGTKND